MKTWFSLYTTPDWTHAVQNHYQSLEMNILVCKITFLSAFLPFCEFPVFPPFIQVGNQLWDGLMTGGKKVEVTEPLMLQKQHTLIELLYVHLKPNPIFGLQWSLQQKAIYLSSLDRVNRWRKVIQWYLLFLSCRTVALLYSLKKAVWWIQRISIVQTHSRFICY